ncbi:hypothetical protein DFH29DRAFT_218436 [Suillus ampliporus]|nr:hypothetical protein DFH29DRAFT_218436 [Suillus ampliporus]
MLTTHHYKVCNPTGFCTKHQKRCNVHTRVFYYKRSTTAYCRVTTIASRPFGCDHVTLSFAAS